MSNQRQVYQAKHRCRPPQIPSPKPSILPQVHPTRFKSKSFYLVRHAVAFLLRSFAHDWVLGAVFRLAAQHLEQHQPNLALEVASLALEYSKTATQAAVAREAAGWREYFGSLAGYQKMIRTELEGKLEELEKTKSSGVVSPGAVAALTAANADNDGFVIAQPHLLHDTRMVLAFPPSTADHRRTVKDVLALRSQALLQTDDADEASVSIDGAIKIDSEDPFLYFVKGSVSVCNVQCVPTAMPSTPPPPPSFSSASCWKLPMGPH